jgi:hypothetical protein
MCILRKALPLCCLLFISGDLAAVSVTTRGIVNQKVFGIEFPGEARAYYGAEAAIQSISKQEYVTATFRVVELNVVTQSSALLRIYHSRPLRAGELQQALGESMNAAGVPGGSSIIQRPLPPQVQAMADRASGAVETATSTAVLKEYPIATHAHTIEFRVSRREELIELHDELKKHWLKEPAYFENGRIVEADEAISQKMSPRSLGGTLFRVDD